MKSPEVFREKWRELILIVLVVSNLLVWAAVYSRIPGKTLKVYFLDVGQGDAIFIETPSRRQVLIDGGKNKKVVSQLGRIMPFGDKSLDIIIATHPDADHIGGLPEVVNRYKVELFIEPQVESENDLDNELDVRLEKKNIETLVAKRGQVIDFGDGVRLTILFPDRDVSTWETNDASIVARLDYGESSFLLTGDSPLKVESILIGLDKNMLDVDVLKAGHHGSRTSTSLSFAQATSPEYAVISAGADNTYGHPHQEVLNILKQVGSKIKSTAESGTIKFETDGQFLKVK